MENNTPVQANITPEEAKKRQLQDVETVRDLFARAHDYIAQATYPGHLGMKVAEVINFLAFQHGDFKQRAETLKKQMESTVNVEEAKAAVAETLADAAPAEAPKA